MGQAQAVAVVCDSYIRPPNLAWCAWPFTYNALHGPCCAIDTTLRVEDVPSSSPSGANADISARTLCGRRVRISRDGYSLASLQTLTVGRMKDCVGKPVYAIVGG